MNKAQVQIKKPEAWLQALESLKRIAEKVGFVPNQEKLNSDFLQH